MSFRKPYQRSGLILAKRLISFKNADRLNYLLNKGSILNMKYWVLS
jgi:hypothetical protein